MAQSTTRPRPTPGHPAQRAGIGVAGPVRNSGNSSSEGLDPAAIDRRNARFELREKARRYIDQTPVVRPIFDADGEQIGEVARPRGLRYFACGHLPRDRAEFVDVVRGDDGRAGFGGLQRCASVWACPVCANQIALERREEVRRVLAWARAEGHVIAMVTLTLSHHRSDPLAALWDAVGEGWAAVTSGRAWTSETVEQHELRLSRWAQHRDTLEAWLHHPVGPRPYSPRKTPPVRAVGDQERYGVVGWLRGVEVRDGKNGWHPHLHVVVVLEGRGETADQQTARAEALGASMLERWNRPLRKRKYEANQAFGVHVAMERPDELGEDGEGGHGDYLLKEGIELLTQEELEALLRARELKDQGAVVHGLASEVTMGATKLGLQGSLSPFQLLQAIDWDTRKRESRRYVARWREWVSASEGRRQLTWSQGLRTLAGLEEQERTDEQIVEETASQPIYVRLPLESWALVLERRWKLHVLRLFETEPFTVACAELRANGIDFELPPPE